MSTTTPTATTQPDVRSEQCDPAVGFGIVADIVGVIPVVGGLASGLFGLLSSASNVWFCGGRNIAEWMAEIARQQAEVVFEENTLEILLDRVDDLVAQVGNLTPLGDNPRDEDITTRVDQLDGMWRQLSSNEQEARTLSFKALPAAATVASLKMGILSHAYETETRRVVMWRDLAAARRAEALESLGYLDALEAKLESHIAGRHVIGTEILDQDLGTHVHTTYKLHVRDTHPNPDTRIWSSEELTHFGIGFSPEQDPGHIAAMAAAQQAIVEAQQEIRDAYHTDDYLRIRQSLQAHVAAPIPPLFEVRTSPVNPGQHLILQPVGEDLALRATDGSVERSPIALDGTLDDAMADESMQFLPISHGSEGWIYKVRDADLTLHVLGGSRRGNRLALHGDVAYAQRPDHGNSRFRTYITWDDRLVLRASDADVALRLVDGAVAGSEVDLGPSLGQAVNSTDAQFRFSAYPPSRTKETPLLWQS